jgi:hypothetical protein
MWPLIEYLPGDLYITVHTYMAITCSSLFCQQLYICRWLMIIDYLASHMLTCMPWAAAWLYLLCWTYIFNYDLKSDKGLLISWRGPLHQGISTTSSLLLSIVWMQNTLFMPERARRLTACTLTLVIAQCHVQEVWNLSSNSARCLITNPTCVSTSQVTCSSW